MFSRHCRVYFCIILFYVCIPFALMSEVKMFYFLIPSGFYSYNIFIFICIIHSISRFIIYDAIDSLREAGLVEIVEPRWVVLLS